MYFRSFLTILRRFSTENGSKQIVQTSKNLINPGPNDPIAFGYEFPKQWNQDKIYSLLDPTKKQILQVKIVHNKLGQSAGKIMFTFKNMQVMQKYIDRYNEDFIQTEDSVHRVVLKKFELKNEQKKKQRAEYNKKYGVNLTNLDFDIDRNQIQRLAQDFGQIEYIEMPMKQNGLNRGSSKIYFKTRQGHLDFQAFADGLKYRDRRFRCTIIKREQDLGSKMDRKEVESPKVVMKWNEQLYKRMVKLQAEKQNIVEPQQSNAQTKVI